VKVTFIVSRLNSDFVLYIFVVYSITDIWKRRALIGISKRVNQRLK